MTQQQNIEEIKSLYPNEWVLLGNLGRDLTAGFDKVTITYAGEIKNCNRLGVLTNG